MEDIKKCQYAGDPNDEYCKTCNGVTMLVDGQELSCAECTAYSPIDDIQENIVEAVTSQETEEQTETAQTTNSTQEEVKQATEEPGASDEQSTEIVEEQSDEELKMLPDGVTVKAIRYMSGMTVQKTEPNGAVTYYKFTAEEEWELDSKVGADSEKVESIREALWDKINLEVDNQVGEALG